MTEPKSNRESSDRSKLRCEVRTMDGEAVWGGNPHEIPVELQRRIENEELFVADLPYVEPPSPVPMILWCPKCCLRHIDRGAFETKPHHTHACQHCGTVWRPALVATVGVEFLPGFKNPDPPPTPSFTDLVKRVEELEGLLNVR